MVTDIASLRVRFFNVCALTIAALAIYVSDSRSALITLTIMIACYYTNFAMASLAAITLTVFLFFATTPYIQIFYDPSTLHDLFHTLPSGLVELISVERYTDFDVNNGWRGYETYRAFSYVSAQGIIAEIFGTGWHTLVPILWLVSLGEGYLPDIPVFHNAFSTLFVRSGYIGLMLFLIQVWIWASFFRGRTSSPLDPRIKEVRKFALGLLLASVASIPFIAGVYNVGQTGQVICLFLGYCIGFLCYHHARTPPNSRAYSSVTAGTQNAPGANRVDSRRAVPAQR